MSNQVDYLIDQHDLATRFTLAEMTGDELTEIVVEALYRAFDLMRDESTTETLH